MAWERISFGCIGLFTVCLLISTLFYTYLTMSFHTEMQIKAAQRTQCNAPVIDINPYNISGQEIQNILPRIPVWNGSCVPLKFTNVRLPTTALASHPGSGNTWSRYLIQQLTGRFRME